MKYLKKFDTIDEYNAFVESSEYIEPNVCKIGQRNVVYNPLLTYLYVDALEDLTVAFSNNAIMYSFNGEDWVDLPANTATPTISSGRKVYFKANIQSASPSSGIGTFTISGNCNVGGNPKSLLYGDVREHEGDLINNAFYNLFKDNKTIIDASRLELTSTSLSALCYAQMFYNCTSLVTAPKLPATTLSERCYVGMFILCTSLVNPPELPATTLASYCYNNMFSACKSLVNAPELPATTLVNGCYNNMFNGCISLVNAPELPATTLVSNCYNNMFKGCSRLQYIKAMFTTTPSGNLTSDWVYQVSATGTFVKNAAATWNVTGVHGIPSGWTVETAEV